MVAGWLKVALEACETRGIEAGDGKSEGDQEYEDRWEELQPCGGRLKAAWGAGRQNSAKALSSRRKSGRYTLGCVPIDQ